MVLLSSLLVFATLAVAGPILPRTVTALDESAVAEAQQRDDTATGTFSNTQIKTSDGRCLFVNELSGDFRENLTPIQVGACGATDGQGWDIITAGKHNNAPSSALVVSTLTNACANFDPRRAAGNQVLLFSCGGRADGGGDVTNSQLFGFNGTAGPLALEPENQAGSCFVVKGNAIDIANCDAGDPNQSFSFAGDASGGSTTTGSAVVATASGGNAATGAASVSAGSISTSNLAAIQFPAAVASSTSSVNSGATSSSGSTTAALAAETSLAAAVSNGTPTFLPTSAVPVSRGGDLNPSAAAEANQRDDTATRAFSSVEVRSPSGQCLFVDPLAGDFRENLIPIQLVDCSGVPNEKWDVITQGAHNDQPNTALLVSALVEGCVSFDGRRAVNDTVTLFSCGGRADGGGQVQEDQLFPYIGELSFALAPVGENNQTCILQGDGKLISGACPTDGSQLFSIVPNE